MTENKKAIDTIIDDIEMMQLILEDKFYCHMINTPLYSIFTRYLVKHESKGLKLEIVRSLKQNDFLIEASSLLIETESFYEPYRTLSSSLLLIENIKND